MPLRILHTNDMHGTLSEPIMERLAPLRAKSDVYFDTGDAIKTGNLGIPIRPEAVWPFLKRLDCTASVPGNRESHVLRPALEAKLAGISHPLICSNLTYRKDGAAPFPSSITLTVGGQRVGVLGVMVPMVTTKMKTQAASAYLWSQPVPAAIEIARELRPNVDLLIALTHIGHREDVTLAESGAVDIILGGHSHTVIQQPEKVGTTWICQGGSHNRFAGVYEWEAGVLSGGLVPLK